MRYGNQINVPGAPGNFGGGAYSPFGGVYPMGNNQNGRDVVEEKRQEQFPEFIPAIPGSSNVQGAIGNMGGMAMNQLNASMYGGPQMGQAPDGFVNKVVS